MAATLKAEEKLVMERELQFLLSQEVPKQWKQITGNLEVFVGCCMFDSQEYRKL